MGEMNDDLIRDIDQEIESAFREAVLMVPPRGMYRQIMGRIDHINTAPAFRITWMDLAVSLLGSISVSLFLGFILFMPAPLQAEMLWFVEWIEYLGRTSMIWVLPCLASGAILAAGYTMTKSIRASG